MCMFQQLMKKKIMDLKDKERRGYGEGFGGRKGTEGIQLSYSLKIKENFKKSLKKVQAKRPLLDLKECAMVRKKESYLPIGT